MFTPQPFARRYLLLDKIATGGMAEVFKAKSYGVEGFEKLVVIKRILPHLSRNARFVSMFINEAKIAVSLNHGNIAHVFHLGKHGEDYFIAMEYVHGRDLMQVLRICRSRNIKISDPLLLYIAAETARGLDYAHRKADPSGNPLKIIHRDISPHNIVISFEGDVKIVDFGIARITSQIMEENQKGRLGGKYAYMSPEQVDGRYMDSRSDLFSLGLVCYEALTGQKAYQGQGIAEKLELVRKAEFVPPRALRPDLSEGLERILVKVLARNPDDRYQSAGDLYEDLTELMFSSGGVVTAQDLGRFMQDLFREEIARDQQASGLKAVLGSLERMDRGSSAPDGISITEGSIDSATMDEPMSGYDPNRTLAPVRFGVLLNGDCVKRNVLVLLVEPIGLADLSLRLHDDQYLTVHAELIGRIQQAVETYGGTVDNVVNDRICALWGLQRSNEHDAERSVACALALREVVKRFCEGRGFKLTISVAVHQGPALVGKVDGRLQYVALGDTVKLPERLLSYVEPGLILVSDVIRQLCTTSFKIATGEVIRTTWGKGEVAAYRVVSARSPLERVSEASGKGGKSGERWFARGDELEVLRKALSLIDERKGMVLGVTGEAGIGKTRFGAEVGRLVRKSHMGWWVGVAQYRYRDTPLAVFRDMFASWCGINPRDTATQVREKLSPLLELGLDLIDLKFVASLFSPYDDGHTPDSESPDGQGGIFRAVRRLVHVMCSDRPNLILFEDLQWMDPISLKLVQEISELTASLPMVVLVTYRSGYRPSLEARGRFKEIELTRLSRERTVEMAQSLIGGAEVPPSLADELFRRSDGNPLHLEQLLKLLMEGGHIAVDQGVVKEVTTYAAAHVPPTVQGLIESRVDGLSEAGRDVLQLLSVVGRRALWDVVREVTQLGNALDPILRELSERDLVTLDSKRISFRNHMTWEVAYNSVLHRQRREYHKRIGETLERLYEGDLRRRAEEIYHHFEASGASAKAARYAALAGDRYRKEDFIHKAIDFYLKAIDLLRLCDEDSVDEGYVLREMTLLSLKSGQLQWFVGERGAAELTLERGLDLAGELEDDELQARLLLELGRVRADKGDHFLAQSYLEHALELSESLHAIELSCMVLEVLGTFYFETGESEASEKAFERGLELVSRIESPVAVAQLLRGKGTYLNRIGEYDQALRQFNRALELAEASSENILCGRIFNNIGNTHIYLEQYEEAMEAYRRSGDILKSAGFMRGAITNCHNIGDLFFRQGRLAKAYSYFLESRNMARDYRWAMGEASNSVFMGYIEAVKGDAEGGMNTLRSGIELAAKSGIPEFVATGHLLEGLYYRAEHPELSAKALKQALEIARPLKDRKLLEEIRKALAALPGQ